MHWLLSFSFFLLFYQTIYCPILILDIKIIVGRNGWLVMNIGIFDNWLFRWAWFLGLQAFLFDECVLLYTLMPRFSLSGGLWFSEVSRLVRILICVYAAVQWWILWIYTWLILYGFYFGSISSPLFTHAPPLPLLLAFDDLIWRSYPRCCSFATCLSFNLLPRSPLTSLQLAATIWGLFYALWLSSRIWPWKFTERSPRTFTGKRWWEASPQPIYWPLSQGLLILFISPLFQRECLYWGCRIITSILIIIIHRGRTLRIFVW